MKTMLTAVRAVVCAALWLLIPSWLSAQGTSSWVEVVDTLQTLFARLAASVAIWVGGLMFALGVGWSKRTLGVMIFLIGLVVAILVN